jgi:hypothetical protein
MRCVTGVLEGLTFQEVADREGYASRGTVHRIVQQTLAQHEAENIEELRALELARLDALQAAFYEDAVAGDLAAAQLVLRIIAARTRLLQLDRVVTAEPSAAQHPVVVGATEKEFIEALQSGGLPRCSGCG